MGDRTAIAFSGGVDSLAAARLLQRDGHDLVGVHFTTGYERRPLSRVKALAERIGLELAVLDCADIFQAAVVEYFARTYAAGQTPNPCLVCNARIKFGELLAFAENLGASRLATGHYARIQKRSAGRYRLCKGRDPVKEQSYFLAFVQQNQLARAIFPLGEMRKSEVRALMVREGLAEQASGESQDICFIGEQGYGAFLRREKQIEPAPGPIVDSRGNRLGRHPGLHLFTIGQRRRINCPAAEPYYVLKIEPEKNQLVVGFKSELFAAACHVRDIRWQTVSPQLPVQAEVRLRYRHPPVPCTLIPLPKDMAWVQFDAPQAAVTPGQGAVFYQNEAVLGAGWIAPPP